MALSFFFSSSVRKDWRLSGDGPRREEYDQRRADDFTQHRFELTNTYPL